MEFCFYILQAVDLVKNKENISILKSSYIIGENSISNLKLKLFPLFYIFPIFPISLSERNVYFCLVTLSAKFSKQTDFSRVQKNKIFELELEIIYNISNFVKRVFI